VCWGGFNLGLTRKELKLGVRGKARCTRAEVGGRLEFFYGGASLDMSIDTTEVRGGRGEKRTGK